MHKIILKEKKVLAINAANMPKQLFLNQDATISVKTELFNRTTIQFRVMDISKQQVKWPVNVYLLKVNNRNT